jgi:hypothetical protein
MRRAGLAATVAALIVAAGCASAGRGEAPREVEPVGARDGAEILAVVGGSEGAGLEELDGGDRFSLEAHDVTLDELLEALSRSSGTRLRAAPGIGARLSVDWREITVAEALLRIGRELDLALHRSGDGLVLDRTPPSTMLISLPEDPGARTSLQARIRAALSPAGSAVRVEPEGLLLVRDRASVLETLRRVIEQGTARDNRVRGGRSWRTRDRRDDGPPAADHLGSPST